MRPDPHRGSPRARPDRHRRRRAAHRRSRLSRRRFAVAAYGEQATTSTITLDKAARAFGGSTSCSRALSQTAQASAAGATGALCSGFRSSCSSSGTTTSAVETAHYHVTLLAPRGQGWAAPPPECSGAGTDRLGCTFTF